MRIVRIPKPIRAGFVVWLLFASAGVFLFGSSPAMGAGVTLFTGRYLTGSSQTFFRDEVDLRYSRIGAGTTRSVSVSGGCQAMLFEFANFQGQYIRLSETDNDLGNTVLSRNSVGSIRVACDQQGGGGGGGGSEYLPPDRPRRGSITLFSDRRYSGESETFYGDIVDLNATKFGNRRASSLRLASGCRATLWEYPYFKGRSTTFPGDDANLSNTSLGERAASSLKLDCRGGGGYGPDPYPRPEPSRYGVTLYQGRHAQGPSMTFDRDISDLDRTPFGSRSASSVDVSPGCIAILYQYPNYRGRSTTFRERDNNLSNTEVGEDTASSLKINCQGGHGPNPPVPVMRGVTIYRDRYASGPSETFSRDVEDLSRTSIGARTASSVDVTPGCIATLYEFPGFGGRSTTFRERDNNLKNTAVGEDRASSLKVSCPRY